MNAETSAGKIPAPPAGTGLLTKAIDVLEIIAERPGEIDSGELSKATGIPKPTLYRILAALTARGLVRREGQRHSYSMGFQFLEMAMKVWSGTDLTTLAAAELRHLRDLTGETAYLAIMCDEGVLSIARVEGAHSRRSAAQLGTVKPLHCTSQGKSLLAHMPDDRRRTLLSRPLAQLTDKTITDPTLLQVECGQTRSRGFAIDDEEILLGTRCVGAPILDATGAPIAAISVAGPTFRMTMERAETLGKEVASSAQQISLIYNARTAQPSSSESYDVLTRSPAFHGVSPVWNEAQQCLTWADRFAPALFESRDASCDERARFSERIEAVAVHPEWGTIAFLAEKMVLLDLSRSVALEKIRVTACGTVGQHLWAAVQSDRGHSLVRLDASGRMAHCTDLPGVVTGITATADGQISLCVEEMGAIYRYYPQSEQLRLFAKLPRAAGRPVDLAADAAENLWVAVKDGWSILRLSEFGEITGSLPMPLHMPTGIACGGPDGHTLFVTSSRFQMTQEELGAAPVSGHVLRFSVR